MKEVVKISKKVQMKSIFIVAFISSMLLIVLVLVSGIAFGQLQLNATSIQTPSILQSLQSFFSSIFSNGLFGQLSAVPIGFTTLSLSSAQFSSSSPYFNGQLWILNIAQGGLGQSATGTISASSIGSQSGTQPASDLNIQLGYSNFQWEYNILVDPTSTPVYIYSIQPVGLFQDYKTVCPNSVYVSTPSLIYQNYCINRQQVTSFMGNFDNCNFHNTATFNVNGQTATIDSQNQISAYIGSNVYVTWNGNLLRQSCPTSSPYKPFYANGWQTGSSSYYAAYAAALPQINTLITQYGNGIYYSSSVFTAAINTINTAATQFTNSLQSFGTVQNPSQSQGAFVQVTPTSSVQVPTYTLYVQAALLGIYQPNPIPSIISSTGANFKSGEYGLLSVTFKNIGQTGNFNVWATCQNAQFIDSTYTVSVAANAQVTQYVKIGGNVVTATGYTCIINVQASGGTGQVVSATVTGTIAPQSVCTANQILCSLNQIQQCNVAGSGWTVIQQCTSSQNCVYQNGLPACVNTGGGGGGNTTITCASWDIVCQINTAVNNFFQQLGQFALVAIIGIILFLVVTRRPTIGVKI